MQDLVISLIEDDKVLPLILSSSIVLEDETSERQVEAVQAMILTAGRRLQRWRAVSGAW